MSHTGSMRPQACPNGCEVCDAGGATWSKSVLAWRCPDHTPPAWCDNLPAFLAWAEDDASRRPGSALCTTCPSYLCGHPWLVETAANPTEPREPMATTPAE